MVYGQLFQSQSGKYYPNSDGTGYNATATTSEDFYNLTDDRTATYLEFFFTLIFVVELAINMTAYWARPFFTGPNAAWNYFDMVPPHPPPNPLPPWSPPPPPPNGDPPPSPQW